MPHRTYNTPKRKCVVKTRLTEDERRAFEDKCAILSMSQSEYIRQAIFYSRISPVIRVTAHSEEMLTAVSSLVAQYGKIGSNLSELLQPEDIPTLQEFLGYCLLPTTKGQKMLMLIGKGGEGKSRIGLVMRSLLGDSMNTTSIQKVESNRFSRADLENKLLMVDDDMDMSALPKTNYIKSIVTSECKMDMERKGVQSYQSQLYVRFLCFGNGALTALHDKSDGFFRRQIVLTTKDRPAGRADDPFLVDKLLCEKEGIFLWCLEGLHRLIGNNYQFSISGKARENMETVKRSSNNVIEFLQSEGYIHFRADGEASSKAIYEAYTRWCDDNAQKPMSANRVSSELAQNDRLYNVEATNNVHVGGKRVRGFMGIEVVNSLPY